MQVLSQLVYLSSLKFSEFKHCEHCNFCKHSQSPHKVTLQQRLTPLDLVHSDVCQMPQLSMGGHEYFVTFIDDATRKVWVYFIKKKDEVFGAFQKFVALVENQTGKKLKCLRSDNGGENVSKIFQEFRDRIRDKVGTHKPSTQKVKF